MKHRAVDVHGEVHEVKAQRGDADANELEVLCTCGTWYPDVHGDSEFDRHIEAVDASAAPRAIAEARALLDDAKERHGETTKERT